MYMCASSGMLRLKYAPWSLTTLQLLPLAGEKATQAMSSPAAVNSFIY